MKKLTKKRAKELCIKKWEYIVENEGSRAGLFDEIPELFGIKAGCAYCELYNHFGCNGCPINMGLKYCSCHQKVHPYAKWLKKRTVKNAQAVLDLIKNS